MINIYLCDDDTRVLEEYSNLIEDLAIKYKVLIKVKKYTNGESMLFDLEDDVSQIDIVYLDIEMGQINGIQIGMKLRELGCKAEIIYLTSIKDYVFECFETQPLHYLLKVDRYEKKFEEVFKSAIDIIGQRQLRYMVCKNQNRMLKLELSSIKYFEVIKREIVIYYREGTFKYYGTLEGVSERVDNKMFIRIHRAFLVNLSYIKYIEKDMLTLITGEELKIGRKYLVDVKERFAEYLF